MSNKLESLNSKKMDLSSVNGGLSPEAAAGQYLDEWITRSNVHMGATGDTYANIAIGNDSFGDLSLDS